FHYPNSLPSRQSFIYIFLMLFVCFRAFMYLEETPKKHINAAFLGSICFVLLAEKLIDAKHFHFSIFYVAIIVLSMYAGVLHMFKIGKRELAACLALILVSVEAAANTAVTSVTITSREAYTRDNEDVHMLMDMVEPSDDFYRVEKKTRKTKNDGAWMNFPSVSLFSSTANADLTEFFKRMGCEASTNSYSITGSTPLVDSLVSIKYALYSEEVPNTELWAYMKESGETYLYENLYTLPLGFVISHSVEDNWQFKMDNPGEVQNDLCQALGNDAVLQWIDSNTSGKNCTFTPDLDGYYYVYVTNKKVKSVKAAVPSGSKTFNNTDRGYLLELGSLVAGNQITLTSQTDGQDMKCEVYRFSDEAMISLYEKLNKTPLKLTSWEDTKLAGTVNAAERGVLFTSIPYETGWTVKIDGEVTETEKIFEAFLSVDIPAGEHEITFEYFPAGLKPGIIITLASIAILAMLFIVDRIMERRYQEKKAARKAAEALEAMNVEAEDETDAMEFEEELPAEDETDSEVSDLEKEE
ncbi:MAG: YfhO family protein, partial [Lachnospiraceae bacterium]|nr:YfhO family protein [Lachnospiraceae bacterium]